MNIVLKVLATVLLLFLEFANVLMLPDLMKFAQKEPGLWNVVYATEMAIPLIGLCILGLWWGREVYGGERG